MRNTARMLPAILSLAGGSLLLGTLGTVAPAAGRPFHLLSFAAGLASMTAVYFRPAWRYALVACAIMTAPRYITLLDGRANQHVLLPIFLGFAAGLLARVGQGLFTPAMHEDVATRNTTRDNAVLIGLIFIALNAGRAFVEYYSPHVFAGYPRLDLEVAPGVSANHAFYLCGLLLVHVSGPLIFIYCDSLYRRRFADRDRDGFPHDGIARRLLVGIALGLALNLAVMLFQVADIERLWIATARSREAGRLPGLFTDAGAATTMMPALLGAAAILAAAYGKRIGWRILAPVVLAIIAWLLGPFLGRGYFLALAGLAIPALLLGPRLKPMPPKISMIWWAPGIVAACGILILFATAFWRSGSPHAPESQPGRRLPDAFVSLIAGDPFEAYRKLNAPRAMQARAGALILADQPLAGSGANSFMVEVRRFEAGLPGLEIDNPSSLPLGLAGDFGVLGLLYLALVAVLYGRDLFGRLRARRPAGEIYLAAIPLILAPTFVFGYHIVFAEYSALLLMPLLLPEQEGSSRTKTRANYLAIGLVAAWLGAWFGTTDFARPPAWWRTDHGAGPQQRPDRMEEWDPDLFPGETLFYYKGRRNFALARIRDGIQLQIRTDPPRGDLRFFCYDPSMRRRPLDWAIQRSNTEKLDRLPLDGRHYSILLPEDCAGAFPNLEIEIVGGGYFILAAEEFDGGDWRRGLRGL